MNQSYKELQKHYETWLSTLGFSQSIIYNYPKSIFYFLEYLENKSISQIHLITQKNINEYLLYIQSRKHLRKNKTLSIAHLNKSFDALDKFIEFLNQHTQTNITPPKYRILQTKNDLQKSVKSISKEEIKTLYESTQKLFSHFTFKEAEPRQALTTLILDLCYGCGLRKSEVYNLLIEDIDIDKKLIYINQGKNYKDRYVPMSATICERIKLFIYQHRRFFVKRKSYLIPLTKEGIYSYFKALLKASEIHAEIGLHTLRHSIATHLLQNGMSVEQISKFLGHSSLESTQVYTHIINDRV
ncbi:MAG: tyrosine-type recombinase/integrase [Chitinophagales bacterium]